jgi:hypothetical protein
MRSISMPSGWRRFLAGSAALAVAIAGLWAAVPASAAEQSVHGFGDAPFHGSTGTVALNHPIVGMARIADGGGYWAVSREGRVATFGTAAAHGSVPVVDLGRPIVGIAPTPSGKGYWIAATDGSVFAFGDAAFHGSMGGQRLNQAVVGIAATRSGHGYWLVAQDGGIFSFGDARFLGSTGAIRLNQPIVGMAATPSGHGYWLVARDGGIFSFGDARFFGSTGGMRLSRSVVGMAAHPTGSGYWLVAADGGVFTFGASVFRGSLGGTGLTEPAVAVVATPSGNGYWIATTGHVASNPDARPAEVRLDEGSHQVGAGGVRPGDYRTQQARPGCRWERSRGASVLAGRTSDGPQVVTLQEGDTFRTSGCAPWTSDLYPVRAVTGAPLGDGAWLVNTDVAPGVWRASGGAGCEWTRVSDFSGSSAAVRAEDKGPVDPVVFIDGSDRGFVTQGCGTWTRG